MARSLTSQYALTPRIVGLSLLLAGGLYAQSISPSSLSNGTIGEYLNGSASGYTLQVVPENCGSRTWVVSAGALPPGVTLTPVVGSPNATLAGKPSQTGTFSFTITATGSSCSAPPPVPPVVQSYTLTIDPLVLSPSSLPPGAVGTAYGPQSLIPGPAQTCFDYSVTSGTIPPGLTVSSLGYSGEILGTPTQAGVFTFTVTATEGTCSEAFSPPRTATGTYTVRILGISTSSLPQGTAGQPYPTTQLAVAGNVGTSLFFSGTLLPPTLLTSTGGSISGTTTTAGTYNSNFSVYDSSTGLFSSRTIPIVVNPTPTFPAATLPGGTVGTLYSAAVAASGGTNPFTYTLQSGSLPPGVNLLSNGSFSGTPTTAGTYPFAVHAVDANGAPVNQSFSITIAPAPVYTINPPTLPAGYPGTPYSVALTVSGFSGPTFSIIAGSLPPGLGLTASGSIQGTPTQLGLFSFTVRAVGLPSSSQSATRDYQIQIVGPLSFVTPAVLPGAQAGIPYHVDFQATGGVPPYYFLMESPSVAPGLQFNSGSSGNVDGTPTTAGTYTFDVEASDIQQNNVIRTFSITVAPAASITTISLPNGFVGKDYQASLMSTGFVSPPTWAIASGTLPDGLTLNTATGAISGTPTTLGTSLFQVRAAAGNQSAVRTLSIIIDLASLDFTPDTLPAGTVDMAYSQAFTPTGGTGGYVFSLVRGTQPPGLSLSAAGVVSGTPTTAGTYKFVVRLTSDNLVIERQVTLFVDTTVLTLTPDALPDGFVGQVYSQLLVPSGGTAPYTFQVTGGTLPPGVGLDSTGSISGKPSAAGLYSFDILLSDQNKKQIARTYSITVRTGGETPGTALPDGTQNEVYPDTQLASPSGAGPFTFILDSGALPLGMALSSSGVVAGTPLTAGDFSFTARITDANGRSSVATYSLRVLAVLKILPDTLPSGLPLQEYSAQLSVSGGTPDYIFELVSGNLPDGILFSAGLFRGSPTKSGTFGFDIKVTDSRQRTTTKHYTITIRSGPSINIQGAPSAGVVGVAYTATFTAQGGSQPYRWSYTGTLPPGLSLNASTGVLSGTPTLPGIFAFNVRLDDADGQSARGPFTVTIGLGPVPPITFNPVPASTGPGSQVNVGLTLTNPYPVALNGVLTLTFKADSGFDDPAVVFASGNRTLPFTIPAGSTGANFFVPNSAFQTGTVAGLITITASLNVNGLDVTPLPIPTQQVRVDPSAPVITRVDLNKTATGFELIVYGFSTPRQMTQALVKLTPAPGVTLQTTDVPFNVSQIFTTYFADQASAPFGSQFRLVLPIGVGDLTAIKSATVTLTNNIGTSGPATVNF